MEISDKPGAWIPVIILGALLGLMILCFAATGIIDLWKALKRRNGRK